MRFVETRTGFVNLDLTARIDVELVGKEKGRVCSFFSATGELLGKDGYFDPFTVAGLIIPAAAGAFALVIGVDDFTAKRPTAEDVYVQRVPIIGWKIEGEDPSPILLESPCSGDRILHPCSIDGSKLIERDFCVWDDIGSAKAGILLEVQTAWDIRQKAELAP